MFSNEADQVVAVDAITGKFKWQYKGETPEEYTLRGHAGVAIDGDLIYTGFSNGTLVALRKDTGSVAWSTSLKADADRFMDVDATPIVIEDRVYASSSSGGVYALDKTTGLIRWRLPFWDAALPSSTGNVGGLASDGKTLYVSVADLGTYAIDLGGNVLWRVGARGGGEPAQPVDLERAPDLLARGRRRVHRRPQDRRDARVLRSGRRRLGAADGDRRRPAVRDVEPRHPLRVRPRVAPPPAPRPRYSASTNGGPGRAIR